MEIIRTDKIFKKHIGRSNRKTRYSIQMSFLPELKSEEKINIIISL